MEKPVSPSRIQRIITALKVRPVRAAIVALIVFGLTALGVKDPTYVEPLVEVGLVILETLAV